MHNVSDLSQAEKIKLVSGATFWSSHGVERLDIPELHFSDGPYGLRKQEGEGDHLGLNESNPAICFPTGSATGATFNPKLMTKMGQALGKFAKEEKIDVLLGPAMNIKRSPLCGRNFEYFSEDPLVTGALAKAYVDGVQKVGVGTSPKHFAVNNQEHLRMTSSSNVDERTLREIYLPAFERVVKDSQPLTIMSAYNRINGTYASDSKKLLDEILRQEWGFEGIVVSDWGASNQRATNLKAGLDISMPNSAYLEKQLIKALEDKTLEEESLDKACQRILQAHDWLEKNKQDIPAMSLDEGHALAKEVADEAIVLLKNEDVLPLIKSDRVLFSGPFAQKPRFQGGGSSHINAYKVPSILKIMGDDIPYIQGYSLEDEAAHDILRQELLIEAKDYDKLVLFVGLPDSYESEGYDRKHMQLPKQQIDLIEALVEQKIQIILVLQNGSPVEIPRLDEVPGIIESYLAGEAVSESLVDILYGKVNPSGHLAETFPQKLSDTATYLTYGKDGDDVNYGEGLFVGYRYYVSKDIPVAFPFGHGLSYTKFDYSDLQVETRLVEGELTVEVRIKVTNIGEVSGKEVVQVYIQPKNQTTYRPLRELKAFVKINLAPGQSKEVVVLLSEEAFSYWSLTADDWQVNQGDYRVQIGQNVENIVLEETIHLGWSREKKREYHLNSRLGELFADELAIPIFARLFAGLDGSSSESQTESISPEMLTVMMGEMPIRALLNYIPTVEESEVLELLEEINLL